jgi:hypothetical protein
VAETKKVNEQQKRFIETARQLECDEDEAAFDKKLKQIARAKPRKERLSRTRKRTAGI